MPDGMPPLSPRPRPRKVVRSWQILAVLGVSICFTLVALLIGYSGRRELRNSSIEACLGAKQDRIDIAASITAHTVYIKKVVLAQSVKEDVKRAAREANKVHKKAAQELTRRSKIDCFAENPKPNLIPDER